MANQIVGLDHAVIAVRDLDQAAEVFRRLGFTLTPRGHHAEWGTANHCAMFGQDYVELLSPEGDGAEAEAVRAFLEQREGLMGLALRTNDGAASGESLRRAGLDVPVPRSLSRRLDAPDEPVLMFSETPLPADATPGVPTRMIQHLTAQRDRHPEWLQHVNGAFGIAAVTAVVDDPVSLTPAWDRVFGPHSAVVTDETVTVHTGRGLIFLTRPEDLTQLHPDAELDEQPPPPALVVLALQVADTRKAAEILHAGGVEFGRDSDGTIRIPPSQACGVTIEMAGA
ncbi:VOC family protein [Magnetospirillum sp. UT-4]|uniref:VOC family protein n=1 Tax=Magnetospirillum sp. UT-4 TaxID=2681467 RepID=UPI0013857E6A|nr:VOC family protein [Magnetospirillum sp. UT-4]CAA7624555.1 conserved hypothetical protein [Magnetospirillum sp. UT-4]